MSRSPVKLPPADGELALLVESLCEGTIAAEQRDRLESLMANDREAKLYYVAYMDLHAQMQWLTRGEAQKERAEGGRRKAETKGSGVGGQGPVLQPPASRLPPTTPPIILDPSTTHHPLSATHSSLGSWAFSYAVATVFVCLLILGAWAVKISHRHEFAVDNSRRLTASGSSAAEHPQIQFVGRITGMADVEWSDDPDYLPPAGIHVSLGRDYKLDSGLMEITYDSGARVILEGPCTYEVESARGGYLERGKLTARVETKDLGFWVQGSEHSPFSTLHSPLFAVRTPTAKITDLGTEFGVEVSEGGITESHVMQGNVEVQVLTEKGAGDRKPVEAGHAVKVVADKMTISAAKFIPDRFVRRMNNQLDVRAENAYISSVLADEPLAYWPLNEPPSSRRFLDHSGNGFHGRAIGSLLAGRPGPLPGYSKSVEMDGGGYIDVGRQDDFVTDNHFSVEAWLLPQGEFWKNNPQLNHSRIISTAGSELPLPEYGWSLGLKPMGPNALPVCLFSPHGYDTGSTMFSGAGLPQSKWTHLAFVFAEDGSATIYLNAEPRATAVIDRPIKVGHAWVSIGVRSNLQDQKWHGRLAHVAVYSKALSVRRILEHYKCREIGLPDNPRRSRKNN